MFIESTTKSVVTKSLIFVVMTTIFIFNGLDAARAEKSDNHYNIYDYGAVGDGVTLNTKAIQAAIDSCAKAGGGMVYFPAGQFLSGTIYLKSNVTLYLDAGAVLLGSTNLENFPVTISAYRSYTDNYTNKSLIYAEKVENIAILGRGVIDGQGASESFKFGRPHRKYYKKRPYMIRMIECKNIMIKDVTIQNSPMWVQHYMACEDVTIDGITVHSKVNYNNDGIDIDSCDKVRISNCEINSGDDAIVLKATSNRACKNVTVTNCVLSSNSNAFKCGTESNGGFENITVDNCTIYDTGLSGIALELVDGGRFDRVIVSNITMNNVNGGIFIRLGNRARPFTAKGPGGAEGTFTLKEGMERPGMGAMSNIIISNIQAIGVDKIGCSITGLPNFPVKNVTLENIRIRFKGGGTKEDATRQIPEKAESYPEYRMFGTLPAYGFYCRHVKNLRFHNMDLGFEKVDHRPALVCEDVQDLDIFRFDAECSPSAKALIWLKQVDGAFIHGCQPRNKVTTFIQVDGDKSSNISLMSNDFSRVKNILGKGKGVSKNAMFLGNNRTK